MATQNAGDPHASPIGFAGGIITIGTLGVCNTCVRVEKGTGTAALRTGIGKARRLDRPLNGVEKPAPAGEEAVGK